MEIRPVETELFHVDGQTDMTELLVAFRNFAERARKRQNCYVVCQERTACHVVWLFWPNG
jgi:hypothetical protein